MSIITVPCATCSGTGWATHEDRHTETNRDQCRTCGGTGQVPARPGESRETSWPFAVPGAQVPGPEIVRHRKSGGLYEVLFRGAKIQTNEPLADYAEVVIYRSRADGRVWARPTSEMDDGRFEAVSAPAAEGSFQARVDPWLIACFGEEIARDRVERAHRFLEEALELVQAAGCTAHEAHQLVECTYGRPAGEMAQEVGGVMTTLAAFCLAHSLDMHEAGETELARIWTKVEKIRAKQAAKPKHSPLPEHPESTSGDSVRWREPDGWCTWPMSADHVLRLALHINGNAVATLEAFSMNGPWYGNAVTPEGERKRLGAGGTLHGAAEWCEKTTGYLTPIAKIAAEQQSEGGADA